MEDKPSTYVRRGTPKPSYKKTLRKIKRSDWEALTSATILALFNREYSVYLRVSYLLRFPKDFPSHKIVEKDGFENVVKIKTKSMMRYLIEKKHTTCSMYDLQQVQRQFTMQQQALDKLFQDEHNCTSLEVLEETFDEQSEGEDND